MLKYSLKNGPEDKYPLHISHVPLGFGSIKIERYQDIQEEYEGYKLTDFTIPSEVYTGPDCNELLFVFWKCKFEEYPDALYLTIFKSQIE